MDVYRNARDEFGFSALQREYRGRACRLPDRLAPGWGGPWAERQQWRRLKPNLAVGSIMRSPRSVATGRNTSWRRHALDFSWCLHAALPSYLSTRVRLCVKLSRARFCAALSLGSRWG